MENKGIKITELRNSMLVSTFFFLWLAINFSNPVEEILAFILIFSFGILHGANDLEILRKKKQLVPGPALNRKILLMYVGFVLFSALVFYLFPLAALTFFILFSAYHFGEQHWVRRNGNSKSVQNVIYFSYGLLILLMMFQAHPVVVGEVIETITGYQIPVSWFTWGLTGSFVLFLVSLFSNYYWIQFRKYLLKELFLLGVFFIVFNTASLLWSFAIYFVVWHSIPSLADQIHLLHGSIDKKNGIKYLKSSAIYWTAALATLAVAFLFTRESSFGFMPLFFSFLAAITFPHVLVITRLYRN